MATTIPTRANGQTIDASWFNIIATKFGEVLINPLVVDSGATLGNTYNLIIADGTDAAVPLVLPTCTGNSGRRYYIKAINVTNAVNVTVNDTDNEAIEGAAVYTFSVANEAIEIVCENDNWHIVSCDALPLLSLKQNSAFTPTTSALWSTVPTTIEGAINTLAAQLLGYSGTVATAGAINQLAIASYKHILLTACTSLNGILNPARPRMIEITNSTGALMTIANNSGGAAAGEKIITGTGADLSLEDTASVFAFYDTVNSVWRIGGGSGGGGGGEVIEDGTSYLALADSGAITITTDVFQQFIVDAATTAGATLSTTPFGASLPSAPIEITIIGNSNDKPVTILHSDISGGCLLSGDHTTHLGSSLTLRFSPTLSRYVEV